MRAPLGAQDVIYKDPNATVQGTRAAAFLFLCGSAVLILRVRGKGGYWEPFTLAMGAFQRKFGGTGTNVLSAPNTTPFILELAALA